MTVTCNDPVHQSRRRAGLPAEPEYAIAPMQARAQMRREYAANGIDLGELHAAIFGGSPCLICGAPIQNGEGHDSGCMGLDG